MEAEKLIAALERHDDISVASSELNGVVEIAVRHTAMFGRRRQVTVEKGTPCWPGHAPIRTDPGDDSTAPETVARLIRSAVLPIPPGWPT